MLHDAFFPCNLSHNFLRRNPLQGVGDMLHIAVLGCNLQWFQKSLQLLQIVERSPVSSVMALRDKLQVGCRVQHFLSVLLSATIESIVLKQLQVACFLQLEWICVSNAERKFAKKLHHVTLAYTVQSLQAQKSCEISCKEGILQKLQEKLRRVTLALNSLYFYMVKIL